MKRTELKRRTPLKRGTKSLKRTAALKRKTAVKRVSEKRKAGKAERQAQVAAAFRRDGWVLVAGEWVGGRCIPAEWGMPDRCRGKLTPHRRRKGSNLGRYTTENVVAACAHHNDAIEDHPTLATALGLVRR